MPTAAAHALVAAAETTAGTSAFQELAAGTERKYIMVSGKGGVGKTSLAASLAVRFAAEGHTTLVVSTDPAHSLGDSLAQVGACASRRLLCQMPGCHDPPRPATFSQAPQVRTSPPRPRSRPLSRTFRGASRC